MNIEINFFNWKFGKRYWTNGFYISHVIYDFGPVSVWTVK